jgi:hypothetical protein
VLCLLWQGQKKRQMIQSATICGSSMGFKYYVDDNHVITRPHTSERWPQDCENIIRFVIACLSERRLKTKPRVK